MPGPNQRAPQRRKPRRPYPRPTRVRLHRQVRRFARNTEPGMRVLDAGAGSSPYREFFAHARYEAADFAQVKGKDYAALDYVCDLTAIPVEDGRFDRIVFTQVLEHVPEPAAVLAELHRVLKPGGRIFCSAPLFFSEHGQPYDFYRFTKFALRRLFKESGFRIQRIEWLEGYFGTVSYQFQEMHRHLPASVAEVRALGVPRRRLVTLAPTLLLTRWLAGRLTHVYSDAELATKYTARGMPKNYVVVARKPLRRN